MAIDTAGSMAAGTGHHHLLIDLDSIPEGTVVPKIQHTCTLAKARQKQRLRLLQVNISSPFSWATAFTVPMVARLTSSVTVDVKK